MNVEMEGRRLVGTPRTRWKDVIRGDLESSGLTLEQAAEEARDGKTWKTAESSKSGSVTFVTRTPFFYDIPPLFSK